MLVSIGGYALCDGTLSGGVAISALTVKSDRLIESVVQLPTSPPEATALFMRSPQSADYTLTIVRTHDSTPAAELFILDLDNNVPDSGDIIVTTTGPSASSYSIPNGALLSHELMQQLGATTWHQYHIQGGSPQVFS